MAKLINPYLSTALVSALLLSACAGRPANPIPVAQIGDGNRSCDALIAEMSQMDADIARKLPDTQKAGKNIALGIAGWFLLVPWFFMDFSQSEQIEIEALRNRYTRLNSLAADKGCDTASASGKNAEIIGNAIDAAKAKKKERNPR